MQQNHSYIPYNLYLAHHALSKLEFPIGDTGWSKKTKAVEWEFLFNYFCFFDHPVPIALSLQSVSPSRFNYLPRISISYEVGQEQNALLLVVICKQNRIKVDTKVLSRQQNISGAFIKELKDFF